MTMELEQLKSLNKKLVDKNEALEKKAYDNENDINMMSLIACNKKDSNLKSDHQIEEKIK